MNNDCMIEFYDKLFELQNEYGMYIHSTEVDDFNGNHVGSISYDNWDGDENGFYTVRYWNKEVCHREYVKKKQ